ALVNYSGHGNVDVWTGAPIFNNSDAIALTNGHKLPLVVVMDCLNGYFVAPNLDCIGESLLKAPNGGAVASFVSSGLTIPDGQHAMGQRLFQRSEEHTSELQSRGHLVCRLLLEKKKNPTKHN